MLQAPSVTAPQSSPPHEVQTTAGAEVDAIEPSKVEMLEYGCQILRVDSYIGPQGLQYAAGRGEGH